MMITVCIFAKPPVPTQVKTRLAQTIGPERAAELAAAFLADTLALVKRMPWARPVIATTGQFPADALPAATLWDQGDGALDARLERILRRALLESHGALALGADSPGLPSAALEEAAVRLRRGDAVIGPATDGGFYLLGVPKCPSGLLAGVPWSTSRTCAAAVRALTAHGMPPVFLPPWFDVDRAEDLPPLDSLLRESPERAPRTAAVMAAARFGLP